MQPKGSRKSFMIERIQSLQILTYGFEIGKKFLKVPEVASIGFGISPCPSFPQEICNLTAEAFARAILEEFKDQWWDLKAIRSKNLWHLAKKTTQVMPELMALTQVIDRLEKRGFFSFAKY